MKVFHLKKLSIIVILSGVLFQIKAQSDSTYAQKYNASISSHMMNVLYIGIDNPISIAVSNVSMDDLIVEITNGDITKIGNNYVARAYQIGECKISVFFNNKGKKMYVGSMAFKTENIPKPEVSWGLLCDRDSVFINQIKENNFSLYAAHRSIGCLERVKYKIQFFEFSVLSKDAKIIHTIKIEGNKLNEEALNILKKISSGNSIMIDRIMAIGPSGNLYLEPVIIYIL